MPIRELDEYQIQLMQRIVNGADIYDYYQARAIRQIEQLHPEYIKVTEPMMSVPEAHERQPYFGVILTKKGQEYLRKQLISS